jgi:ubiquinone/menaquinone biosynthesis C-methylase UbiE
LQLQDRLINEMIGGLFPEREELDGIDRMLDIGCGSVGWALDVAHRYPEKKISGIDSSNMVLAYANEQKKLQGLENIHFEKMNARQKLGFADGSFDLVNMHGAAAYVPRDAWPGLLRECYRVTQPGGIVRVTEADRIGLTNSEAFEQYHLYYMQMLHHKGYGFSPGGDTLGITPMLGKLLQDAGYTEIQARPYALDFSYGTPLHPVQCQNIATRFQQLQPDLVEMEIATRKALERLYEAVMQELGRETFCGIVYLFVCWGKA